MPECPVCGSAIIATPGRPRKFCSSPCQIKAANARRQTTRAGRRAMPMTKENRATVAQIFGSWFVRVNGQLAVGPMMNQLRAQDHADRLNKAVP
jgi:predicted nucleic acid-binding Zn ribbon protein